MFDVKKWRFKENGYIDSLIEKIIHDELYFMDQYEFESLNNKSLRKIIRALSFFAPQKCPDIFVKKHLWAENFVLLGEACMKTGNINLLKEIVETLKKISLDCGGWGLPIDWHSGEYVFKKGTLMSTTTSEVILFLCECLRYPGINVSKQYITDSLNAMLNTLNRVGDEGNLYSYTPEDNYIVNNANLLICAAITEVAEKCDSAMKDKGKTLMDACIKSLNEDGGITYFQNADITDGYHQLFCMRSLYIIGRYYREAIPWYKKTKDYFERVFLTENNRVLVRTDKEILDLMATTEALRFYNYIDDSTKYEKILEQMIMDFQLSNGSICQRIWKYKSVKPIKSRNVFMRQGIARLLSSTRKG